MHYCKDKNLVLLDTVDNAAGETMYKTASDVFFYDRPRSWLGDNILNSGEHLDRKVVTEATLPFFVVLDSLKELCLRLRMK